MATVKNYSAVSLSELLPDEDEYEAICQCITHEYTWGDTDVALVEVERFLRHLNDDVLDGLEEDDVIIEVVHLLTFKIRALNADYVNLY